MTDPRQELSKSFAEPAGFPSLLEALRGLIADSRRQVLRAVDTVQVKT